VAELTLKNEESVATTVKRTPVLAVGIRSAHLASLEIIAQSRRINDGQVF
jgi:hypothetical protein